MKTADKSVNPIGNFNELISKLSGDGILDLNSMIHIRGGDEEGNGSPIIIPPPKPV